MVHISLFYFQEMTKKLIQNVEDQKQYENSYQKTSEWLQAAQKNLQDCSHTDREKQEIQEQLHKIQVRW